MNARIGAKEIAARLGGRSVLGRTVTTERDLHRLVLDGVPPRVTESLITRGVLTRDEIELIVPKRTLARRRVDGHALHWTQSDALVRLVRVVVTAESMFDDALNAGEWLRRPDRSLGGASPLELAYTDAGMHVLEAILASKPARVRPAPASPRAGKDRASSARRATR